MNASDHRTEDEVAPDCEEVGGEHAWERQDYDPSVGLFGGRVCVTCGKTDEDRCDDEIDF